MIERLRRRTLVWLNSAYLYGRLVCWTKSSPTDADDILLQPLLHTIIILIEFTLTIILITKFNAFYVRKPILTTMLTNAVSTKMTVVRWPG